MLYKLKDNVILVNEVFAYQFLAHYIDVITYLCEAPDIFLGTYFNESVSAVICWIVFNVMTWKIAAEFHDYVVKSFTQWCRDCISKEHNADRGTHLILLAVKNELHLEPIALSCKYFSIKNGLLISVRKL